MQKPSVIFEKLSGLSYEEVWDYQTLIHKALINHKRSKIDMSDEELLSFKQRHRLMFCEHNHVYTLGKSGSVDHLLIDEETLSNEAIEYFKINRGGDITYHGPGQLTVYPIFDLDDFFTDVHKYVRFLEEAVIMMLGEYGIVGERIEGFTGVWIIPTDSNKPKRKICAIGVHLSRWVTMHGLALNINTDLKYFQYIVPCGIDDDNKVVTSMEKELGRKVDFNEVMLKMKRTFALLFEFNYTK